MGVQACRLGRDQDTEGGEGRAAREQSSQGLFLIDKYISTPREGSREYIFPVYPYLDLRREALLEVALAVIARIRLAFHKRIQRAHPTCVRPAERERLHRVVHEQPHALRAAAVEALDDHARGERHDLVHEERARGVWVRRVERRGLVEEAHGREDRDHLVVVREVRVERAVEREGFGRGVERAVRLRVVRHVLCGEARDELVDVADALDGAEGLAVSAHKRAS